MRAKVKLNDYKNNSIKISGSKNSSLPIIAASILCDEYSIINNVPNISDIHTLINILKKMNYNISFKNNTVYVQKSDIKQISFNYSEIKKLRGSYYLIGALIGKYESVNFSFLFPGGCKLGDRPIDMHIKAFNDMGLSITEGKRKIYIKGNKKNTIHTLSYPSVGTTINIILASCKLEEKTIIHNASIEPEVIDVCNFINSMGASITIKNRTISIKGCSFFKKTSYTVMEDRIEAGTFLLLGAIHKGITITNVNHYNLLPLTDLLIDIGYKILFKNNSITIFNSEKQQIKPFNIKLVPHPGIPTDLGPLLCVLASQIDGESIIEDTIYINRLSHIKQLSKMNVNIYNKNNTIYISKSSHIKHAKIKAFDLRCSAALVIAASMVNKYSYINNIEKLFRGYENIKEKLYHLGIEFIII